MTTQDDRALAPGGLAWCKSSYSGDNGGQCLEAAVLPGGRIAVRDSKSPEAGILTVAATQMHRFLIEAKTGRFDATH